jgi:enterochelin esterase-like enzyme
MRSGIILLLALVASGLAFAQIEAEETRSLEIAETLVEYEYVVPDGFTPGDAYPVLIVLPPGEGGHSEVNAALDDWFRAEGRARGWVVVVPLAPLNESPRFRVPFFLGSETLIPSLLDHLASEVAFEGGQVHIAGASNAGVGAFRVATLYPERFRSVLVLAGWAEDADLERIAVLAGTPMRMYGGELDVEYLDAIRATYEAVEEAGVAVELVVVDGDGHRLPSLDGAELFDWLDAQRR